MKPVATGLIVTPAGGEGVRPAELRFDAGPKVIPVAIRGLVAVRPVPTGACVSNTGKLRSVVET